MTRTVYIAECHNCHQTRRFDSWHQRHLWIEHHTSEPITVMGKSIPQDHEIHHYTQDWHGQLD